MFLKAAHYVAQNTVKPDGRTAEKFNCLQFLVQYKSKYIHFVEQLFFSARKRCVKGGTFIERLIGSKNKAHFVWAIKFVSNTFSMSRR